MVRVERRQPVLSRQLYNYIARNRRLYGARHNQAAIRTLRECRDGALDLAGVTHADRADLHPERWRRGLDRAELGRPGRIGWILKERRSFYAGCDLLEQPQPFRGNAVFIHDRRPSPIAPAPVRTLGRASALPDRPPRNPRAHRSAASARAAARAPPAATRPPRRRAA